MSDAALRQAVSRELRCSTTTTSAPIPLERSVINDGLCMGVDLSGKLTDGDHRLPGSAESPGRRPEPPWGSTTPPSSGSRSSARPATPTSWRPTGSTSSSRRSASGCRPSSRPRWWSTTPAPVRSDALRGLLRPGIRLGRWSILGTKVVMEVRAREVPFIVYDGQTSFKVWFERLAGRARAVVRGRTWAPPTSGRP